MAEEHRCQAPEGHRLCVNNCGFFGSPGTMNLCSKCYRDVYLKEQQEASIKTTVENSLSAAAASSSSTSSSSSLPPQRSTSSSTSECQIEVFSAPVVTVPALAPPVLKLPEVAAEVVVAQPNRCLVCKKRVGLTGFKCRCGTTFCGVHRYPEKHGCTFDFKRVGREEIARANPLVKAEKLDKI
ncbi:zinc finger A20 and AN1 domain-containing stress-associated protein 6-like [Humulus lupulus]|uniref:zinc finger A20 and AN1 domain-containing stress-associated protein 6-like n=1 Tax=Humulus lupulus TaxID=3486 RepID=UPI002B407518|nr:zinc finger A20 and AN1 domain-containing stress-associated protein 6-like [Humulus lupulus]